MKKIDVGQIISMLANIGVIAGIVFLGLELRQNATATRAQTRNALSSEVVGFLSDVSTNPQFASVFRRGIAGEELTPDEEFQFRYRQLAAFRYFENVHYQYRQGLYDDAEYAAQREAWKSTMSWKRVVDAWCNYRMTVSAEFRAELDSVLTTHTC
jgi:hypothetical protein